MEDYNADFLTMLETWEAAVGHFTSVDVKPYQPNEIAKVLDARGGDRSKSTGTDTFASQRHAAEQAGLSKDQQVQAVRPATSLERPPHPLND